MIGQPLLAPARLLVAWVVALVVLANAVAHAETPPSDLIAPSLVYLKVDFTPTKGPSSGVPETDQATGFLVSEDGFILTSYHLLEKVGEYAGDNIKVTAAVGDPQALPVTAAIVNGLQPLDVLLLKIRTTRPLPPLTLGRADLVNVGDHIYTSGFHGTDPFNSEGTVSNKFGPLGIGYLWTVNMPVAAGQSGSPVYLLMARQVGIRQSEKKHGGHECRLYGADRVFRRTNRAFAIARIGHPASESRKGLAGREFKLRMAWTGNRWSNHPRIS